MEKLQHFETQILQHLRFEMTGQAGHRFQAQASGEESPGSKEHGTG
jgi:hypothetical protein